MAMPSGARPIPTLSASVSLSSAVALDNDTLDGTVCATHRRLLWEGGKGIHVTSTSLNDSGRRRMVRGTLFALIVALFALGLAALSRRAYGLHLAVQSETRSYFNMVNTNAEQAVEFYHSEQFRGACPRASLIMQSLAERLGGIRVPSGNPSMGGTPCCGLQLPKPAPGQPEARTRRFVFVRIEALSDGTRGVAWVAPNADGKLDALVLLFPAESEPGRWIKKTAEEHGLTWYVDTRH